MPRGSKRKRDALRDEQNMKKQVRFTKDDEMPAKPEPTQTFDEPIIYDTSFGQDAMIADNSRRAGLLKGIGRLNKNDSYTEHAQTMFGVSNAHLRVSASQKMRKLYHDIGTIKDKTEEQLEATFDEQEAAVYRVLHSLKSVLSGDEERVVQVTHIDTPNLQNTRKFVKLNFKENYLKNHKRAALSRTFAIQRFSLDDEYKAYGLSADILEDKAFYELHLGGQLDDPDFHTHFQGLTSSTPSITKQYSSFLGPNVSAYELTDPWAEAEEVDKSGDYEMDLQFCHDYAISNVKRLPVLGTPQEESGSGEASMKKSTELKTDQERSPIQGTPTHYPDPVASQGAEGPYFAPKPSSASLGKHHEPIVESDFEDEGDQDDDSSGYEDYDEENQTTDNQPVAKSIWLKVPEDVKAKAKQHALAAAYEYLPNFIKRAEPLPKTPEWYDDNEWVGEAYKTVFNADPESPLLQQIATIFNRWDPPFEETRKDWMRVAWYHINLHFINAAHQELGNPTDPRLPGHVIHNPEMPQAHGSVAPATKD